MRKSTQHYLDCTLEWIDDFLAQSAERHYLRSTIVAMIGRHNLASEYKSLPPMWRRFVDGYIKGAMNQFIEARINGNEYKGSGKRFV